MEDSIIDLKRQIDEVKKIEEDLTRQLQEKIKNCFKERVKDPLSEGRHGQNNFSI